ncbi:MAG: hypothetical protein ACOH2B_15085 [Burkholderiaceae bacterium]
MSVWHAIPIAVAVKAVWHAVMIPITPRAMIAIPARLAPVLPVLLLPIVGLRLFIGPARLPVNGARLLIDWRWLPVSWNANADGNVGTRHGWSGS